MPSNDREQVLQEIQRRIAEAKGYTCVYNSKLGTFGTLHEDEGATLVPRWPWDWCDAGELVKQMESSARHGGLRLESFPVDQYTPYACAVYDTRMQLAGTGCGDDAAEAIARCWCAWKGIDLSDLPHVPPEGPR